MDVGKIHFESFNFTVLAVDIFFLLATVANG